MVQAEDIFATYAARFSNLDEVSHFSIMMDPRFLELMAQAVATDQQLTREKVIEVFGEAPWED